MGELKNISIDSLDALEMAQNEEEFNELLADDIFTYSTRLKTAFTYGEFDSARDEDDKEVGWVIRLTEGNGGTYSTVPFSEKGISLTGESVIIKGAINI